MSAGALAHTDSLVRPQIVENQRFVNLHRHHLVRPQVRAAQPLQVAQLAGAQTIAVPLEEEIHDRLPGREEEVEGEPFQERGLTLLEPRELLYLLVRQFVEAIGPEGKVRNILVLRELRTSREAEDLVERALALARREGAAFRRALPEAALLELATTPARARVVAPDAAHAPSSEHASRRPSRSPPSPNVAPLPTCVNASKVTRYRASESVVVNMPGEDMVGYC